MVPHQTLQVLYQTHQFLLSYPLTQQYLIIIILIKVMFLKNTNRQYHSPLKHPRMKKSQHIEQRLINNLQNRYSHKKRSNSKYKNSQKKNRLHSIHATFDKKLQQNSRKKCHTKSSKKKKYCLFDRVDILESKEFQQLRNLENEYRISLKSDCRKIQWLVPKEELHRHSFSTFSDYLKEEDFLDMNNLMINFLHFVCMRRIVRDEEFDYLYEGMRIKFPDKQQQIKKILTEILAVLES